MKLIKLLLISSLFVSCRGTKISDNLCSAWDYLKYPVVSKGYIGEDLSPQGEICYQRKWKSYIGLSRQCIVELLGEPIIIEKNEFKYYFSSWHPQNGDGAEAILHIYFRYGKVRKIRCSLA
jgi:hypothetical protein